MSVLAVIGTYRHRIDTIVCFSEGWKSGFVPCNLNKAQACTLPSFYFFFWQLGHRETMLLEPKQQHKFQSVCWRISCAPKSTARCPSSYPKAFRLLPKSGSSKVCFELLETFRVTPKALPPGCLPKSDNLFFSYILITKIHLGMALSDLLLMQPTRRNKILNAILHDRAIVITLI